MSTIERIIAYGALAALLVIGIPWYFEHRGAKECVQAEAAVVSNAEVYNTQVEATQSAADSTAKGNFDEALHTPLGALPPVPPSVQPQACPSPVPATGAHPAPRPAAAVLRAAAPPSVVQPDWHALELGDVQGAHDADAEVIYLHSLLEAQYKLCGGKTELKPKG